VRACHTMAANAGVRNSEAEATFHRGRLPCPGVKTMKPVSRLKNAKSVGSSGGMSLPARVMLVEDDPVLAMATEEALREAGVIHVDVCATTENALELLRGDRPDAVILDVHLSDRDDGWAIAELIGAMGEPTPKIVFATGAPKSIPPEIAERGVVIAKPYLPEELLEALSVPAGRGLLARLRGTAS